MYRSVTPGGVYKSGQTHRLPLQVMHLVSQLHTSRTCHSSLTRHPLETHLIPMWHAWVYMGVTWVSHGCLMGVESVNKDYWIIISFQVMSQKHDRVHPLLPNAHIMSFLRRQESIGISTICTTIVWQVYGFLPSQEWRYAEQGDKT